MSFADFLYRWRLIDYFVTRVKGNLQIIDQLDLVGRTSEFARVFGIEFYHVLSRGSQVRCLMFCLMVLSYGFGGGFVQWYIIGLQHRWAEFNSRYELWRIHGGFRGFPETHHTLISPRF